MATAAMDDLAKRYADRDVRSVFLYTREAHPGEYYRHHASMEDKRNNARAFIEHENVSRPILLDTLAGDAHKAYGILPNMTWIISRGGIIHYKSAWTNVEDVEDALSSMLAHLNRKVTGEMAPYYSERLSYRVRNSETFRAGLERNGPQSVTDFFGKN